MSHPETEDDSEREDSEELLSPEEALDVTPQGDEIDELLDG